MYNNNKVRLPATVSTTQLRHKEQLISGDVDCELCVHQLWGANQLSGGTHGSRLITLSSCHAPQTVAPTWTAALCCPRSGTPCWGAALAPISTSSQNRVDHSVAPSPCPILYLSCMTPALTLALQYVWWSLPGWCCNCGRQRRACRGREFLVCWTELSSTNGLGLNFHLCHDTTNGSLRFIQKLFVIWTKSPFNFRHHVHIDARNDYTFLNRRK